MPRLHDAAEELALTRSAPSANRITQSGNLLEMLRIPAADDFNISNSMTIVCPITSRMKPFFLHQELPEDCCVEGDVVMEQVRAVDLDARNAKRIGSLSEEELQPILICIQSFFEMD